MISDFGEGVQKERGSTHLIEIDDARCRGEREGGNDDASGKRGRDEEFDQQRLTDSMRDGENS